MASDNEKEALLKRLLRLSSDELVLARMRAHGFWPLHQPLPPDPPEELDERTRLEREAAELAALRAQVKDAEAALEEERKRRWAESKKRRAEARAKKDEDRKQRRLEWEEKRKGLLVNAGDGVSGGLQNVETNEAELERRGLPVLRTSQDLAAAIGVSLARLRWLTFHRKGATLVHYHRYQVPKKGGGMRAISAPKPTLSVAQQWVRLAILERLTVEPEAHGFVRDRSVMTNAAPHVGRPVVVNLDVRDFFPSITFRRVKGLFRKLGYGEHVATVLALLCTEPPRLAVEVEGRVYHVALGARQLPQGACTSPGLTNAICRKLDRRLAGLARRHGFTYTRYADDLTFSGDASDALGPLLKSVRGILRGEKLEEHPAKTRVMRRGRRQEVTGVTVNDKLGVGREYVRELRAILHNAARHGLESQNRDRHADFRAYLRGRVEYACMVDPSRRPALQEALAKALAR